MPTPSRGCHTRCRGSGCRSIDVQVIGDLVDGVITARVKRLEQHPDAAKVQRVYVDAGDGVERHVWCGAFNIQPGDVVPLATLGTAMPDGRTIERRGILGIDSEGMLCAADELGLGDDHSGIMILPTGHAAGRPLRRGARHPSRRAARRRRHSQPARLLGLRRHRPRPRRPDAGSSSGHRTHRRSTAASPARRRSNCSTASAAGVSRARSCRASVSARARRGCSGG